MFDKILNTLPSFFRSFIEIDGFWPILWLVQVSHIY